ncbi:hypothetical protein RND81_02G149000 [Saponaria officinalis]|uniref:Uncharacterized protein n=1 Tax=Saponaria officinalis TaxID=3572 RepID=A0AAW1MM77_SAPOF
MSRRFKYNADEIEEEEEKKDDDHKKIKIKSRDFFTGRSYKRVKKVVFNPFNKVYTRFIHHTRSTRLSSNFNNLNSDEIVDDNRNLGKKGGKFISCCFCFSKPQTLETSVDDCEQLDDPNVNYECLKSLIENNDFYSKECNTLFSD